MSRIAILLAILTAAPCAGQTDTVPRAPAAPMRLCWRGKPIPACRSFWITEVSGEYAFASTSVRRDQYYNGILEYSMREQDVASRIVWTVGPMFNLTPTRALGGTLSFGFTDTKSRLAIEGRRRDWYSGGIVDFSAGLVRMGADFSSTDRYGLTTGVYLGGGDLIHLTAHGDLLVTGGVHGGGTVGAGLGSYPAAGATVLFVALGILAIAAIANSGDF